jgi:hypothetical protein
MGGGQAIMHPIYFLHCDGSHVTPKMLAAAVPSLAAAPCANGVYMPQAYAALLTLQFTLIDVVSLIMAVVLFALGGVLARCLAPDAR